MRTYVALSTCLVLSLAACGGTTDRPVTGATESAPPSATVSPNPSADLTSLAGWKGEWNNIARYLDEPALAPGYEAAAAKHKSTPEKEKSDLKKRRASDFGGLTIEGDRMTFFDDFPAKSGKKISSSQYTFDKTYKSVVGGKPRTWYAFKATAPDATYPVVMFFPIDPQEDLRHFHMRYGKNPQEILAKEDWFPTVVAPATTTRQLITEVSE